MLYDIESEQAGHVADRMRRAINELAGEQPAGESGRVTISAGVAALKPSAGREPRGALQLADQALYKAKLRGRNRVEVMEEQDYRLLVTGVFSKGAIMDAPNDAAPASKPLRAAQT